MKNKYIIFAGMGLELVGIMIACLFFGQKLEEVYNLKGLGMIAFSVLGLAGWLIQVISLSQKLDKSSEE